MVMEMDDSVISPRNIFLHFVDHEFLTLTSLDKAYFNPVLQLMRQVVTAALLVADNNVYMPASAYFESEYARNLFNLFPQFRHIGLLCLVGSAYNAGDFVEAKRPQYAKDHGRYPRYFNDREVKRLLSSETNWLRRLSSASHDISIGWSHSVDIENMIWVSLAQRHDISSFTKLEKTLLAVPERLGKTAFIADFVLPLLQIPTLTSHDAKEINAFITQQYNYSYLNELGACCLVDLPFADSRSVLGELKGHISYRKLLQLWRRLSIDHFLFQATESELIYVRNTEAWSNFLRKYCLPISQKEDDWIIEGDQRRTYPKISFSEPVKDLNGLIDRLGTLFESVENSKVLEDSDKRKIIVDQHLAKKPTMFIVHGHDERTKWEVKNYLQNTLHLPEPIILHEQSSLGRTIIEKFEAHANKVDGAIILLTPDDTWVKDGTNEEIRRARQNVIFELGYFCAKFGRESGRVLLLYKGKLDLPSDIGGLVYIDITHGVESAGEQIRRELAHPS